jgi:threonine dehydratase
LIERPQLDEFLAARQRLNGIALHTPLVPLHSYADSPDIFLKLEIHQPINSFKIRGVYNAVASLSEEDRQRGLFTTSAGNTAQALAWCARHFGVSARSMMPESAPRTKVDAVRAYGGEPVFVTRDEIFAYMTGRGWEGQDYTFIHPWTNRDVLVGHGSAGLEIAEDMPDVETVYIPVGGGGLFGGVASALKAVLPDVRVVAVEPEGCPALSESLRAGRAVSVDCHTICDGVAVPFMTDEMYPLLRELADDCVLVSEHDVIATIRQLALGNRIIVEGAGALAAAAAQKASPAEHGKCVAIVTGGSIDTERFLEILAG